MMNKKFCDKCKKEYDGDLDKCPDCDNNLFEQVADLHVAAIIPETELYPELDKEKEMKE